jgi:hypothetical protein
MKASIRSSFRNGTDQSEIPARSKNVLGRSYSVFFLLLVLLCLGRLEAVGQIWDNRTSAENNSWNDIVYSSEKNLFVAVARTGTNRVMTSTDGITWTARTTPTTCEWNAVTYASWTASVNNKVLTGNVATLTTTAAHNYSVGMAVTVTGVDATFNGTYTITATTSTTFSYAKTASNVSSAAVSPVGTASAGWFVATGSGGSAPPDSKNAMTSPDGITWTERATPENGAYNGVAYGNGVFVAMNTNIGVSNHNLMTSSDGVTWTAVTPPAYNSWRGLTFADGKFVAVSAGSGSYSQRAMVSTDGTNWTLSTLISPNNTPDNQWNSVVYGNGLFVAVSQTGTGNRVMTSANGTTWTSRTPAEDNQWYDVTFGNGRFIAVANSGSGNRVMTSTDGINWSIEIPATDNNWRGVAYGDGRFVAVANSGTGNRVMTREADLSADLNAPFLGTTGDGDAMNSYVFQFALPLSLLDFTGEAVNSSVRLRWKTAWEQGTSAFEVERSTDGVTYTRVGAVKAAGNSQDLRNYEFMDANPPSGILHYRLRQVDADGKFGFSQTVRIRMDGRSAVNIGPNPTGGQATLRLPSGWTGLYECRIINASGAVVYRKEGLRAGSHTLDLSRWAPGLYRVTLWENGESVDQQWLMRR